MCNKEAGTVARVLISACSVYQTRYGKEFINQLWKELFQELKILHTNTPPYNPSSNIVERWHWTISGNSESHGKRAAGWMGSELESRAGLCFWDYIPGSCDKSRSYWTGPYKMGRKIAPALEEVMEVYKQGKPGLVSIDVLKEFRGDNGVHGLSSDPSHSQVLETNRCI